MRRNLFHRRSPVHAFSAWLCVALHLAVFTASGWHFHGPGEHRRGGGGVCVPVTVGDADCCGHEGHASPADHGGDERPPRDGRDPEGCCICKAILALHHGALPPPVVLPAVLPCKVDKPVVRPQVGAVALLRRERTRGPPMTDA